MFDLAGAYVRTGLTQSPDNDALLTSYLDVSLSAVEKYLNRLLMYKADQVEFVDLHHTSLQLHRFPVVSISSIAPSFQYLLHKDTGVIIPKSFLAEEQVEISYEGGYAVLPADLEFALWLVFDIIEQTGSSGSSIIDDVESVTLQGVGTVRFASNSSGSGSSGGGGSGDYGLIPSVAVNILKFYRLEFA